MSDQEYRVVWKRAGLNVKRKRYAKLSSAEKFAALLTDTEPWKRFGLDPDKPVCCYGYDCGCGGLTNRESWEERYSGMPPLESVRIESRDIGIWAVLTERPSE